MEFGEEYQNEISRINWIMYYCDLGLANTGILPVKADNVQEISSRRQVIIMSMPSDKDDHPLSDDNERFSLLPNSN